MYIVIKNAGNTGDVSSHFIAHSYPLVGRQTTDDAHRHKVIRGLTDITTPTHKNTPEHIHVFDDGIININPVFLDNSVMLAFYYWGH